ncbi:exonuclease (endogenous virus) [Pseudomonas phage phiAH14a]|uniref:Exonuclease n=1 Tax=Pseudomonas phage phiAH14a TaxID=1805958 RepID=A0A1B0VMB3_9CAUD|nr:MULTISPECIES: lambda exonuclease family protein [unclassified Pseudomonas]YP_010773033.1 exonuclease [Pseudomonas phage phiAH14a]AMW64476.1 exonuclease [Pseudomonas phage phiAH14a]KAA0946693.1 YqaJ viral recombinase family protein [Pseudomonas sp. ANT_H4]KAA0953206.1 YqaJ viral recombinase family protein [Pseudomonas sp. ANT_H14]
MQIITEIEQGSPEWLALRLGIVTCSELECLLVNGKGESGFGVGAFTYMNTLIGERITGEAADPFQGNRHTERGHELEAVARKLYEEREEVETTQVAIILNHGAGYSPDSLVGAKGLTEIKTKLPKFQVEVILSGEIPKEHVAQCQGGLWVSEREWIDFVCYWPGMPLFIKRAYRDEAMIRKLTERVKTFYEILDERMNQVLGIAA